MRAAGLRVASPIVLALSGGGDSVALLHLLTGWMERAGKKAPGAPRYALIVDHGLRKGSGAEAKRVAAAARTRGWQAHILVWKGPKPEANIEDEARKARYLLMGQWCQARRLPFLLVAHTADDVAETFLLRLGRGSGVDGLSAMRVRAPFPVAGFAEMTLLRPLLDFGRAELRLYLEKRGSVWTEDPMNADPRFARTRIRALLPVLAEAGIPTARIIDAARHLARARDALEAETDAFLKAHALSLAPGQILFDGRAFAQLPVEIGLRALSRTLGLVSGAAYRPRFDGLEALYAVLVGPEPGFKARTLQGCRVGPARKRAQKFGPQTVEITRESARKSSAASAPTKVAAKPVKKKRAP